MLAPIQKARSAKQIKPLAVRLPDAAKILSVSERTLAVWVRQPDPPPHFRRGNVMLFPVAELSKWLARQVAKSDIDVDPKPAVR